MSIVVPKYVNKLIQESLAIEAEHAKAAGKIGYMARALVQATMPHKNPGLVPIWGRKNGNFSMVMQPGYAFGDSNEPINLGLPYGTKPRLVMAFLCSEAVKKGTKEIALGNSLSEFMEQLGLTPTGGRWGSIPLLKEQMKRLFSATVSFQYENDQAQILGGFKIASQAVLLWSPNPEQAGLWDSTVTLTQEFYDEITGSAVPIDMRALSALKSSCMALDIYCWLTYRMSYLKNPTEIPWELLAAQFGSEYKNLRDFKLNFLKQLKKVTAVYPSVQIIDGEKGLLLKPSLTHITKKS